MLSSSIGQNRRAIVCVPRAIIFAASTCLSLIVPVTGHTQDAAMMAGTGPAGAEADPSIDYHLDAAESEGELTNRRFVHWNEYEGPYFTARFGGGLLYDY